MADNHDSSDSIPATPDEVLGAVLGSPASPGSAESSEASTPLDPPADIASKEIPKRVPSLRSVSDSHAIHQASTLPGSLASARRPPVATNMSNLAPDVRARMAAFHNARIGPAISTPASPLGGSPKTGSPVLPGGVGGIPLAGMPVRPGASGMPRSAPSLKTKPTLGERRKMKLGNLPGSEGATPTGTPKLSDMGGGAAPPGANRAARDSKLEDFKKYIDTERGWITFEGDATITSTGVNFSNGQAFSISLKEIQVLGELGKGNYGTVYKVRHAKSRFAPSLADFKRSTLQKSRSDPSPVRNSPSENSPMSPPPAGSDGTSGVVMAMKEIRLELEESKFTTILKELVILHECVSPYIIDFYGAFFQEGAVYMCIEYMDGGSIDKLYTGGIPENVLRIITYSTIMGLKVLKDEHKIIHRDVKPTNILVNTQGQVKICDFGVSGNLVASKAKTNIGCQSYMAPERIAGGAMPQVGNITGTYSVQSDIWSLGLTIIECAVGRYPYPPEVSSTIFSQLNAIVEGEPPAMPSDGYSTVAQDFVQSCLQKDPKKRPTYDMLLGHPWIAAMSMIETITEEPEDEEDEEDGVADGMKRLSLHSGTENPEVAEWVASVLKRKAQGLDKDSDSKPALHAAPLDRISPASSPKIGAEPVVQ